MPGHIPPRILVLTRQLPHIRVSGARMRNWQHLEMLRTQADVAVFCVHMDADQHNRPLPSWGTWHVHLFPLTLAKKVTYAVLALFRPSALRTRFFYKKSIERDLENVLTHYKPDYVIMEELWLAAYVPAIKRHACTFIFDAHNIEYPLYKTIVEKCRKPYRWLRAYILSVFARTSEALVVQAADKVWVCSEEDKRVLQITYNTQSPIHVIPNVFDAPSAAPLLSSTKPNHTRDEGPCLLFCANFSYEPNVEAAQVLIEDIFPSVRAELKSSTLLLIGNNPARFMKKASRNDASISVTGFVEDVQPYIALADIAIIPLYQGGGTRLKILEAIAAGIPIVATEKACEGLGMIHGKHALISNDPAVLAQYCCTLWSDNVLRTHVVHNASELLRTKFTYEAIQKNIAAAL